MALEGFKYKCRLGIKRFLDVSCASIGLVVFSPLFAVIALAIRLDSRGPVFFLQERLGKNGVPFRIIKFRTMVVNAEYLGDGLRVSSEKDTRITRVGRILRATSLDELPQLVNVIKGDMSLVGPRPPVVYHPYDGYDNYPDWAKGRFAVRPGITGWAQVSVRASVGWVERIKYDLEYVDKFSVLLDFRILLLTLWRVVRGDRIYLQAGECERVRD
jgi:undecaprenyl phosphate N,N'-diacetylbacillosamine 1-phosphate transferase